ncbi:WG repeat-containing protein [Pseudophaeobacter sp.]|uniref:SEL1-like repeat protein n=1 Tax=Pseudophaeobacter sp. TaxID=1971739 RepID=UPI003296AC11
MAGEITLFPLADKQSDLAGYINSAGGWVLEPQFEDAESFSTYGVAPVELDGKWGVIDTSGEFVVPPKFESIAEFQANGLAVVQLNRKYGMINSAGEITIEAKFTSLDPFEDRQVAMAKLDNRIGFVTRSGEFTPLDSLNEIGKFSSRQSMMARVFGEAGTGVLDGQGNLLLPPQYEEVALGSAGFPFAVKQDGLWGFMAEHKIWVIEPKFESAMGFNPAGTAAVQYAGLWGIIDIDGQWVLNPELDAIIWFLGPKSRSLAIKDGKYGVLSHDGSWILPPQYPGLGFIDENDNLAVHTANGVGLITLTGEWIIPAKWESIRFFPASNLYQVVNSDGKKAVFTSEGKQVSDFLYTYIFGVSDELTKVYFGDDFTMGYLGKDYQPITFNAEDIPGLNSQLQTRADGGDPEAQLELGSLLWHGVGHRKDVAEGLAYLKMAAHQGYPPAQKALADFYFMESPSKANWALALMWDSIAKQNGAPLAGVLTTTLSGRVSPEILPLIELRASQCLESGYSDCLE